MRFSIKFKALLLVVLISLVLGFGKNLLAGEIVLNDLRGQPVKISSYIGKPVILFFWTTWCPYCRRELNDLNEQYPVISKEGIIVLAVNVEESVPKVERFFKGFQLKFNLILDQDGELANKYDLIGVPTYVFLDKTGKLVSKTNRFPKIYKNLLFK